MSNLISTNPSFMKNIILVLTVFLGGCHNYYKEYYQQSPSYKAENIISYVGEPKILRSGNTEEDVGQYLRKGYAIIGISNFNSGEIQASSQSKLKEAAKGIGAEVVLWNQVYTNTVSGTTAYNYYTPQTQTSHYSGNISNNYRPMSTYNYSGSMTTCSQVQNTAYVPYSIRRYDYSATFFGKLKDIKLGFFVRNLSSEERTEKHLNSGYTPLLSWKMDQLQIQNWQRGI